MRTGHENARQTLGGRVVFTTANITGCKNDLAPWGAPLSEPPGLGAS
jgi:hypothetical protein